jgi:hypothetical protein
MSREEKLPPNYAKLDKALRSIGYSFEASAADIIDNSVDAKARNVLVRFILHKDKPLDLIIWDDGTGMTASTLKEAMRFGADVSQELDRLGKFGLGLKLASLSQAKELRVLTCTSGEIAGRGWLETGISSGFVSTILEPKECKTFLRAIVPDKKWSKSGTVVWWSQLYRVGQNHSDPEEHVQKLLRRLKDYLSLAFNRFLSGTPRRVDISIDIFDGDSSLEGLPMALESLDPFGYPQTGNDDFPADFVAADGFAKRIKIRGHIWPPNSTSPEYFLPGGANSRQGFYFYRNNRLIQGGGWNGLRETEPHLSLARVELDMHPDFDVDVSLDVKKVEIQLPLAVAQAIQQAKTPSGLDFKKYLSIAQETYRTKPVTEEELPLIPVDGLPAELRDMLLKELRIEGTKRYRKLKFTWSQLDEGEFFRLDRDNNTLSLNKNYRRLLLHGLPGSSADIPVIKCLLFFVLRDVLYSQRMSAKTRERIEQANRILAHAVKHERGVE